MSFKQRTIKRLEQLCKASPEEERSVIRNCIANINEMQEEAHENIPCAMPDYEAMYHEAMKKLQDMERIADIQSNEIRNMQMAMSRLEGYRNAVERIFGEGV